MQIMVVLGVCRDYRCRVSATMNAATAAGADTPGSLTSSLSLLDDPLEQRRFTRSVVGAAGEVLAESALQLAGLRCAACGITIEAALRALPGVRAVQVNAASERATVRWDPALASASGLIAAVRRAGYDAVPDAAAPARALRRRTERQALWRLFVAAFCAMQVMMFATPAYVAAPGELGAEMQRLLNWGSWILTLPVLAFSAAPFFSGAWHALRARRIGMDVPVALGIAITFVASSGAAFAPGGLFGHEVYFDSLTMFVSFLLAARWLELRARHRAAQALEQALAKLPETAWRVNAQGAIEPVSVLRLHPGDRVQVALGQAFPADGELEAGTTLADEALLSGESAPVAKAAGDALVAGSINVGSPVRMRVQRVGGDTRLEAIVSMMKSAAAQRPALARVADRWAAPFLWAVLLLAALGAAVWSVIDPARAVWVAVSVLIVTCPCALSLAAPATLVAAARGMARRGVLVQRLDAIEALAQARHVVFDKTGTLTDDRLQLAATRLSAEGERRCGSVDGALGLAASLARWSAHPAARALAAASPAEHRWTAVHEQAGQGIEATGADGARWQLGRAAWVQAGTAAQSTATTVALGRGGVLLARFELDEALRPDVEAALQALRADGAVLHLASGDTPARAQALAARLGIEHVLAGATPQAKLAHVAALQQRGERVVMVGDGVNDAPVLARADASLAMGQGALVSRAQADAVITGDRIESLVQARRGARKALAIVRQNMRWAGAYNALCIPLALLGWLPPWAAGLGMAASSLVVVANALRAARG
jgi:P-type Cu2+ transporter